MPLANPDRAPGAALPAQQARNTHAFAMRIPQAAGGNFTTKIGVGILCCFLFLMLGRATDFYLAGFHIPMAVSIVAMVVALFAGRVSAIADRNALLLIGMTIWMILGLPFSLWKGGSVEILNGWLKSVSAFLLITMLVSSLDDAIGALKTFAYATLCVAVLSLRHGETYMGRFVLSAGLYSGPNELAYAAVLGVIAWGFMVAQPRISFVMRGIFCLAALFTASLQPRTGSRAGVITMGAVLLVALFRLKPSARVLVTVGSALAGTVMFLSLPSDIKVRYMSMFKKDVEITSSEEAWQVETAQGSSQERMNLLVDSLMVTMHRPIFGVGIGNFGVARTDADLTGGRTRNSYQGTHNTYTQISSEAGVPALVLFLCLIWFCWRDIKRVERMFAGSNDPEGRQIYNAAFTLRLMLISFSVFFFFAHIGYDPFHISVYGLITAFSQVAERAYVRRQALAGKTVAVAAAAAAGAGMGALPAVPRQPQPALPAADVAASGASGFQPRYRFGGRLARPGTS